MFLLSLLKMTILVIMNNTKWMRKIQLITIIIDNCGLLAVGTVAWCWCVYSRCINFGQHNPDKWNISIDKQRKWEPNKIAVPVTEFKSSRNFQLFPFVAFQVEKAFKFFETLRSIDFTFSSIKFQVTEGTERSDIPMFIVSCERQNQSFLIDLIKWIFNIYSENDGKQSHTDWWSIAIFTLSCWTMKILSWVNSFFIALKGRRKNYMRKGTRWRSKLGSHTRWFVIA